MTLTAFNSAIEALAKDFTAAIVNAIKSSSFAEILDVNVPGRARPSWSRPTDGQHDEGHGRSGAPDPTSSSPTPREHGARIPLRPEKKLARRSAS